MKAGFSGAQVEMGLFVGFGLAFASVLPMVPLHLWLPGAEQHTTGGGRALIAALLLPLGPYGFIRLCLPLFPNAAATAAPYVMGLALVGLLYAILLAALQSDLVRRFAFISIAQLSLVVIGIFSLTGQGFVGAVVAILNHCLTATALFLVLSFLYDRREVLSIQAFSGLARPMPVLATLFSIIVGASLGLPLLSGFVGEILLLAGISQGSPVVLMGSVLGVVGVAILLYVTCQRMIFGPLRVPENRGLIDLDLRERCVLIALIIPMLWIGIHPNPVLRRVEPSVLELMRFVDVRQVEAQSADPSLGVLP